MGALILPHRSVVVPDKFDATSSLVTFAPNPTQVLIAQTAMAGFYAIGNNGANNQYVFSTMTSAGTFGVRVNYALNNQWSFAGDSSGAATLPAALGSIIDGSVSHYYVVAGTWDGGVVASATYPAGMHAFDSIDGSSIARIDFALNDGSGSPRYSDGQQISIGGRPGGTSRIMSGDIFFVARWNRILALHEMERVRVFGAWAVPNGLVFYYVNGEDWGPYRLRAIVRTAVTKGRTHALSPPLALPRRLWVVPDVGGAAAGQTVIAPAAAIVFAGAAPNLALRVPAPAGNIAFAGQTPSIKQPYTVLAPAASVVFAAPAPTVRRSAIIAVPVANIVFAGQAPTIARTARVLVSVPAANIDFAGRTPTILIGGAPVLPPAALAQLYGGGFLHEGRKKKKREEKPPIEVMVRAIANESGAQEVIQVLPKRVRVHYPDPGIAIISELVKQVEQGSDRLKRDITRLYEEQVEDEEDDLLMLSL